MKIECAISPCPNDTFLFGPIALKLLTSPFEFSFHFADIEELNQLALKERFPLIKISLALLPQLHNYSLLDVGCAIGVGCGPKVISTKPTLPRELEKCIVAVPGKHTTAYAVFKHLFPKATSCVFCTYDQIFSYLKEGKADCGLIIHESRFTFRNLGFHEVIDLGTLWEQKTQLPLPLGGLALHNSLSVHQKAIESFIYQSLKYSYLHREKIFPFIFDHAQEKDPKVIEQHIQLYVTHETESISLKGKKALQRLL